MPVSRKRRSTAKSQCRRELHRRRSNATIRRMVDLAEQRVDQRAREAGRKYCIVCPGARMRPFKVNSRVVENLVECKRCGRREEVAYLVANRLITAEFEKMVNAINEATAAQTPEPEPAICGSCAGVGRIEYLQDGVIRWEYCIDCGSGAEVPEIPAVVTPDLAYPLEQPTHIEPSHTQ